MATSTKKARIPQVSFSEAEPKPLVLITGPESFFADRANRLIRERLTSQTETLEIHDIDAASYTSGELFTLASPSLFAEPRLIRATAVEQSTDAFLADVKTYIAEPADDTVLVLRHTGGQRAKALLDAVRGEFGVAVGAIEILCPELKKDSERINFAQSEFRSRGATISSGSLRALVAAHSTGIAELAGAIEQLITNHGERITDNDVLKHTEGRVEAGAFKVADAAIAGRTGEALVFLRHALNTGTDPIPLLAAINMKVRAMARVFASREPVSHIATTFSMAPWQVERAQKDTRGWTEAGLAAAVSLGAETELALKGGSKDPEYALEKYLTFIARKADRHNAP